VEREIGLEAAAGQEPERLAAISICAPALRYVEPSVATTVASAKASPRAASVRKSRTSGAKGVSRAWAMLEEP
jgi:hypothetical protein